jgi:hypothetical protein
MAQLRKATTHELLRMDAIAKHLGVKSRYPQIAFGSDVAAACVTKISPVIKKLLPCTGEHIALALGEHLCLTFEEVHGPEDVDELERRYLKGKREIGFAQMRGELSRPGVDALLFQRMHAKERDPDRWVAILNLQQTAAKAYWNRFHELAHRIAEPPQGILPFRRHQFEATNPVEALIDSVAAEFAFYAPAIQPRIQQLYHSGRLDFGVVDSFRDTYAPTASLLATMKAVIKLWPSPAAVLTAEIRGRKNAPAVDRSLRVTVQGYSGLANSAGLTFFPNMRVPTGSPIDVVFQTGGTDDADENLGRWDTSTGASLRPLDVHTSSRRMGCLVYALISI